MHVLKLNGKIFGATLTSAEKKALTIEVRKAIEEENKRNLREIDALVLYILHTEYGFGVKRLKEFFETFGRAFDALNERYELQDGSEIWLATKLLKEYGVDIDEWEEDRLSIKKAQEDEKKGLF